MAKEIGPKERQLRAMREYRLSQQQAVSKPDEKAKPVKRKPRA